MIMNFIYQNELRDSQIPILYWRYKIILLRKRNVDRIHTARQQEDLILLIVINAEVNVRCVMVFFDETN